MRNAITDTTRQTLLRRIRSEDGVSLIHVGMLLFVLMGLSTFVLDYGVLWLARGQAQNAADAGALAGAIARAYDETGPADPVVGGATWQSAMSAATAQKVVGTAPTAVPSWTCPPFAPGRCVRMDVFRDGTNGSDVLPTYFANAFGITSQRIKATATAQVLNANATNCMKPWAIADKWSEVVAPAGEYNHWIKMSGKLVELNPHDVYTPASDTDAGTGYSLKPYPGDLGTEVTLKVGTSGAAVTAGWFLPLDLPDGAGGYPSGANVYRTNISKCTGVTVTIGDKIPTETGNMVGPTKFGFDDLVALDPGASFNTSTKEVQGSCAPQCAEFSPRIVPITVFNMDDYQRRNILNDWSGCPGGGSCVTVANILGFYVDRLSGGDVVGYLMMYPGLFTTGAPSLSDDASFAKVIQLIQ
jgi:hypothetical protein